MAESDDRPRRNGRNGDKLSIPIPFEDAVKRALEVPPPAETKRTGNARKPRKKKSAKP